MSYQLSQELGKKVVATQSRADRDVMRTETVQSVPSLDSLPSLPEGYSAPQVEQPETLTELMTESVSVESPGEQTISQPTQNNYYPVETEQQSHFRKLRDSRDRVERERDEALRLLSEFQSRNNRPVEVEEPEYVLGADELAEGKHLTSVQRKIKNLESQLRNYQQQTSESAIETKVKMQYPDFDSVVNKETIDQLKLHDPEYAQMVATSTDVYSKAISVYKQIKKLGIVPDHEAQKNRILIEKNLSKPKVAAQINSSNSSSPLAHANEYANELTPEMRESYRREMFSAMKGR